MECESTICSICEKTVWKCDYQDGVLSCGISEHSDGSEVSKDVWVCSDECWEIATDD